MKAGPFRYEALLQVFQSKEDLLEQEMATLERERRGVGRRIRNLLRACEQTQETLVSKGRMEDAGTFLRYMEGMMVRIHASRSEEARLRDRIAEHGEELKKVRTERMRFGKLKEQHLEQVQRSVKRLEQKVSDEFAQRKQTA
jgi:flagellar export protein FliJ